MKKVSNIELVEGEINNILKRPPNILVRAGTSIICLGIVLLVIIAYVIKYQDAIEAETWIKLDNPVSLLSATKNGTITYVIKKKEENYVFSNESIAFYETSVSMHELAKLKDFVSQCKVSDTLISIPLTTTPSSLNLGEIGNKYLSFLKLSNNYQLNQTKSNRQKLTELKISYEELLMSIMSWEKENLIISPIDGKLIYLFDPNMNSQQVHTNDKLFAIIPNEVGNIIGKIRIPQQQINFIRKNSSLTIKMEDRLNRPYQIEGQVQSIAVPSDSPYVEVDVLLNTDLFYKLLKNENMLIKSDFSKSTILLREERLIERIFAPILDLLNIK